ncbi:MAG: hypothetical protein Q9192_000078 [Flavoplaca navasiana]
MPSVQDGLNPRNTAQSKRKAGPASLPTPVRKRKYEPSENSTSNLDPFTIRQFQQDLVTNTFIFQPRLLIPRSSLPLAYLDVCVSAGDNRGTRLFSAQIPALETPNQEDAAGTLPLVLIAESGGGPLYAIERVEHGIYVQCKLAGWIRLRQLEALQDLNTLCVTSPKIPQLGKTDQWWRGITGHIREGLPFTVQPNTSPNRKTRCDLRKPAYISRGTSFPTKNVPLIGQTQPPAEVANGSINPQPLDPPLPSWENTFQTSDDLLRSIQTQYKESLYRSKASLAYFAKGPLSRARAGFSDDTDGSKSRQCLVEHLRTFVIPLDLLDKKYREALPGLVKDLPNSIISDDERHEVVAKYKKPTRKTKKDKIGKNGLYPEEELDVLNWWLDYVASVSAYDSLELMTAATATKLLEQRTRETFLQIVVMLEILALESSQPNRSVHQSLDDEPRRNDLAEKKQRKKKAQDISLLLDLSIDRLCIWQSMAVEKTGSPEKIGDTGRANIGQGPSTKKQDINRLREFCVDVVLPFYAARLPVLSRSLCKKLGGPSSHSPVRPNLKRVGSSSLKPPKPGATVKRSQPQQARRTLERVLTNDRASQKPPPRLSRSATDSLVPSLKREPSEIPLARVPVNKPDLHLSKRYSQREVDLTAVCQAKEAKAKKKAEVDQELQGAIAALKRPNPRLAVKELVESAERRATGAKSRKPKHPVRNPFAQNVQIMATPSANRHRDVYASQTSQIQKPDVILKEVEEIPPSSCLHVPASTTKLLPDLSNAAKPQRYWMPTIKQTPTRGPSKFAKLDNIPQPTRNAAESVMIGEPSVLETTGKSEFSLPSYFLDVQGTPSRRASTGPEESAPRSGIESTPVKPLRTVSANLGARNNNIACSPMPQGRDVSIYQSLGWDDDVDELM